MYKDFVERAMGENYEDHLRDLYGGSILGSKIFIKAALNRVKARFTHNNEVSSRRELDATFKVDIILDSVDSHFKVPTKNILEDKKEKRNIAI